MPAFTTAPADNDIVNRAFQSVTGLTPETATGKAPVGYAGEARGVSELSDVYKFGAANPYTPPPPRPPPSAPAPAPATPAPAPLPVQNVAVHPVVNIAPPALPAAPIGTPGKRARLGTAGAIKFPPAGLPRGTQYPLARNHPILEGYG
jgi:hypothetical protein